QEIMNWVTKKNDEFAQTNDNILFVNQNSDVTYDSTFHAKGSLPANLDTVFFTAPVGTIIGPYEEAGSLKLSKLVDTRMIADSVKARHILLKIENSDTASVLARADSLRNLIKKGTKFEDLATKYSTDAGSAVKGGDLGWFT